MGKKLKKGFSLIEVLIALTILAGGVLVVIQMQAVAIDSLTVSRHLHIATELAQRQLESFRSLPYNPSDTNGCSTVDGAAIRDKNNNCYLYDDDFSDDDYGPYLVLAQPLSDLGQAVNPAEFQGVEYYVRWQVMQGGATGTTAPSGNTGMPGPGQALIRVEVIWWEEEPDAMPDLDAVTDEQIRSMDPRGHIVSLTALRQQDF